MPNVLRIIDANANRAREALRVMEEAARFVLDDAELTEGIKRLRHDLAAAMLMVEGMEENRDTPGDVGTTVKTEREAKRESVAAVVVAAGKRLSEALRAIEEYGKTLGARVPGFARSIEALRYRGYDLEQKLNRAMATGAAKQWRLCVLISQEICRDRDWWRVAQAAVEGGADCIQLREKTMDAGELLSRSIRLVTLCRPRGVSVVINDRPDVALLSGADGVHLGQGDLPCGEARRLVGTQLLIGVSTSELDQAKTALRDGADYCGIGPMFNTNTKLKDVIVGPAYAKEFTAWGKMPHLAIGGINPTNVRELVAAGARGVAVSFAICSAFDPAAVIRDILRVVPPLNGAE
ncbi:MAG: thiamine phosphate synthase [Planctomycetes bacterium]|nr:thiamine phosphate synthase [Planctomycetota bacterium]